MTRVCHVCSAVTSSQLFAFVLRTADRADYRCGILSSLL